MNSDTDVQLPTRPTATDVRKASASPSTNDTPHADNPPANGQTTNADLQKQDTGRSTSTSNAEEDVDSESRSDAAADPHHHTTTFRTLNIVDAKATAAITANHRLAHNLRSRANWKQAASLPHQLPQLDTSDDTSQSLPLPTSSTGDEGSPASPEEALDQLATVEQSDAPLELPAPIPPHPFTFIPHLPSTLKSTAQTEDFSPNLPGAVKPAQRALAPRAAPQPSPKSPTPASGATTSSAASTAARASGSTQRPHVCPLCTLAFARAHDLKRHSTTHTGEKKFKCNSCGKAYGRKDALKRHACAAMPGQGVSTSFYTVSLPVPHPPPVAPPAPTGAPRDGDTQMANGETAPPAPRPAALEHGPPPPILPPIYPPRQHLQAPPIVGAAASMMGSHPSSGQQIRIKEIRTAEDYGTREPPASASTTQSVPASLPPSATEPATTAESSSAGTSSGPSEERSEAVEAITASPLRGKEDLDGAAMERGEPMEEDSGDELDSGGSPSA